MKKRLLLTIVTIVMLLASARAITTASFGDGPQPTCNPITDPQCKPTVK